jgi:hypothetical protein
MRVACVAVLMITIGWSLPSISHAQRNNVFNDADKQRFTKLSQRLHDIAQGLHPNADYSRPPTIDEDCRRTLLEESDAAFSSIYDVAILVSISSQMAMKEDEAIVNRIIKQTVARAALRNRACPEILKRLLDAPGCNTNPYIVQKANHITELCTEVSALLNEFSERVKNY